MTLLCIMHCVCLVTLLYINNSPDSTLVIRIVIHVSTLRDQRMHVYCNYTNTCIPYCVYYFIVVMIFMFSYVYDISCMVLLCSALMICAM